ncbi:hypothetical protein GCM10020000_25600 [Streptomyces olivoverticillatus]
MRTLLSDTALVFGRYARQSLRSKAAMSFGALMPALYLVLYGPLLTDMRLGSAGNSWQVLVPGLLLQLALFGASFAGLGLIIDKQHGIVERMRVTPVSRVALLLGRVLRDAALLTVQSVLLVLVAFAMGLRAPLPGILIGFAFTAVLALSLASLSYTLAMKAAVPPGVRPGRQRGQHAGDAAVRPPAAHVPRPGLAGRAVALHAPALPGGRGPGRLRRRLRVARAAVRHAGGRGPAGRLPRDGRTPLPALG